jgi:hypothetical protein
MASAHVVLYAGMLRTFDFRPGLIFQASDVTPSTLNVSMDWVAMLQLYWAKGQMIVLGCM